MSGTGPQQLKSKTGDGKDLVVVSGYAEVEGTDLQGNVDGTLEPRKDLQFLAGPRWVTGVPGDIGLGAACGIHDKHHECRRSH